MNNKENIFQNNHNDDWKYLPMNILGETFGGLSGKTKDDFNNGNKKYISYKRIFQNALMTSNDFERVSISKDEKQNTVIFGDCLFTTSSETPDEVAMSSVFLINSSEEFYLNSFSFGYRFNDLTDIDPKFYGYYFRGPQFRKETYKFAQGSTRYNISKNKLTEVSIPIPPLNEQQKIAEILSTIDEQIDQTNQLIEKTKEIKKGLMQELFSKGIGHTSYTETEVGLLPSEWMYDYIDNFAERKSGHTPDKKNVSYWQGTIPWISLADLSKLDKRDIFETNTYTTNEGVNNSSAITLPKGTIVISRDATVGKIGIMGSEMATSQHFINYICGENLNNIYLYYYLLSKKELFKRIAIGSTIKTIGLDFFKKLKIVIPPIDEQHKIANIFTTVDDDIEGYEQEKEKYKELKKGLMQQLLTGKIRVKVDA